VGGTPHLRLALPGKPTGALGDLLWAAGPLLEEVEPERGRAANIGTAETCC